MRTLITDCEIITPGQPARRGAVGIERGAIRRIFAAGETLPAVDRTVDAAGKRLLPGFIDLHFHGRSGYDITAATPEATRTIAVDKLSEGVTTLVPATLTLDEARLAATCRCLADYRRDPAAAGAKIAGVHLEGPFINCKCLGAQNPDFVRPPDLAEVMRLHAVCPVLKVTFAIEVEGGIAFVRELAEAGIAASCGHSAAGYADFVQARAMGLSSLTHFCNQMTPLHHRDIGLVGGGLLDDEIYTEIIADKIHLSPDMLRLIFKTRDIRRILLITDAMQAAGLPDGRSSIGGLEVIVSGGEARLAANGALAGSMLQFNTALKNVTEVTGMPPERVVAATSLNQAESLGLTGLGRVAPGYAADLVLLDDDFGVAEVWVDGESRYRR